MNTSPAYVLDANVFIEAHRRYYGLDFCPGFWEVLANSGPHRLVSVDKVKDELTAGNDDLKHRVEAHIAQSHFASTAAPEVVTHFQTAMQSVQASAHYLNRAKTEFAQAADGWIAAYAKHIDAAVVTHEVYDAEIRKRVKLPNICRELDVPTIDTFELLRQLEAKFVLES